MRRQRGSVVNLPRAQRALESLDHMADAHPEVFQLTAEQWRAVITEDEKMAKSNPPDPVAVRLPRAVLDRVDAHRQRLGSLTGLEPTRSAVIRLLVERGLETVEATPSQAKARKRTE